MKAFGKLFNRGKTEKHDPPDEDEDAAVSKVHLESLERLHAGERNVLKGTKKDKQYVPSKVKQGTPSFDVGPAKSKTIPHDSGVRSISSLSKKGFVARPTRKGTSFNALDEAADLFTDVDKLYFAMVEAVDEIFFDFYYFNLGITSLDAMRHYDPSDAMRHYDPWSQKRSSDNFIETKRKVIGKPWNFEELAKKHKRNSFAETCKSKGIPLLDKKDVTVLELMSVGPYAGNVCKARWTKPDGVEETVCLRYGAHRSSAFLHEAEMATLLQHDNILRFHGVIIPSSYSPSVALVVEFAEFGNLEEAAAKLNVERLCTYAAQAAAALEHLEKKKVFHQSISIPNFLSISKNQLKLGGLGACEFESALNPEDELFVQQKIAVYRFAQVFSSAFQAYEVTRPPPSRERMIVMKGVGIHGPLCPTYLTDLLERCLQDKRPSISEIRRLLTAPRCLKVRVVSGFTAESHGHLNGNVGELVTLISRDRSRKDKNLWFGQNQDGDCGFFRKDLVEEVWEEVATVPPEIRARGPRAELAFQKALRNGKVQVYRGRIMLIGQDRAGKTSLKKSLLGLPFDPQEESTVGVEVDPSKFEVDVDQVKNWQRTDEKKLGVTEYVDGIARMMAGELNRSGTGEEESAVVDQERTSSSVEQVVDEDDKETTMEKSVVHPTAGMALNKTSHEDKDHIDGPRGKSTEQSKLTDLQSMIGSATALPDDVTERVIQYLQRLKLEDDVKAKETILTLWDFAGQHLYYASHSVFLSPRAVYILVYNLSKELSATAEPCVRQGIHDVRLENPNDETNMDSLLSWLVSVHSILPSREGEGVENNPDSGGAKLPYLRPPVLIVGTNADRPFEDAKQMESRVKKSISGKTYEKHVIRPLFSVDNSRAVTDAGLCALQKRIMDVLKQEPYMGEEVPIRWFNFEKVVEALVAKKTYHMNLDQLVDVIRHVCFIQDDDELAAMLNFYHDLGVIVKHGRTVVLQAQWLIDLFKKLITVRPFDEADPVCAEYWGELEKNGILRMELVDHVFADLIQQGLGKQDILDMMELYGLIAKFSPSSTDIQLKYFVPAQLTSSPRGLCEIQHSDSDPCPLYFHFLDGFVPHGLFAQIVSRCIRWCSDHGPNRAPNLYHNGARFFLGEQTIYDLIVICRKRFIKIVLKQRKNATPVSSDASAEMAVQIREFLEETLQGLSRDLPWLRHLRYELCVACPGCLGAKEKCVAHKLVSCTHDDCLHLVRMLPEEQLICDKSFGDETLVVCGLKKWLNKNKGIKKLDSSIEVQIGASAADQQLSTKSGSPSTDDLLLLAREVGKSWQNLGRALRLDEPELVQIEADKPELFERCYGVLRRWTEVFGSQATYDGLARALQHSIVNRSDLAAKYCDVDGCRLAVCREQITGVDAAPIPSQAFRVSASSPSVFLSYQWDLQESVKILKDKLEENGISCWMDIREMGGGDALNTKIDAGIRACNVFVCCVTEKYCQSDCCQREATLADALKKPIIPLLFERISWPPEGQLSLVFTRLLYINFTKTPGGISDSEFQQLVNKLKELVETSPK